MKQIYNQIVHVHFRWGGEGYIQVSFLNRQLTLLFVLH